MIKKSLALIMAFAMLFAFTACGEETGTNETTESATSHVREVKTKVAALSGPAGLGLVKLAADRSYAYDVQFYNDSQEIVTLLKSGEVDIAALTVDAAAKLYNEMKSSIQILAVNTLSNLHVIETGSSVKSIADLKGKTVYATGEGTADEYVIKHVLSENGIDPEKNIDLRFIADPEELAALAVKGEADICILPEPYVSDVILKTNPIEESETGTTAAPSAVKFRNALHINDEWDKVCETPLAQVVIAARTEYITANPDIIAEFIGFNEVSVNFLTASAETGAVFLVDNGYFDDPTIAMGIVANSNTAFIESGEMKTAVAGVLEILYAADPASLGGAMPDDGFYYGA